MAEPILRVLSVAHTAVSRQAGRLRYHPLAQRPDLAVHLLTPKRWYEFGRWRAADPGPEVGITLHVLPIILPRAGLARWYLHFYPGLAGLVDQIQPHVLHFWEEPWSLVALQGAWLQRRRPDMKLVLEVDQNIHKALPPPFNWIRRRVLSQVSLVLSRSEEATSVVRANGYQGPVRAIGYGVDEHNFYPCRRQTMVEHPSFKLGYVGRIVVEKGLDDALDALALTPGVTLSIMGEGPHQAALEARARQLGVSGQVQFRDWGSPAEVAGFIRGLDVLLLLTRSSGAVREQFGRVITEAQACGVPVIGSTSGAIPSVIGPGGWVVPEQDPPALARLLAQLQGDPAERAVKGQAGIANVKARFTYAAVADTLASAWSEAALAGLSPLRQPGQTFDRVEIPEHGVT